MSTPLDIELIPEVQALIDEFGKLVIIRDEPVSFGPTGVATVGTVVEQAVTITPPADPDTLDYISDDVSYSGKAKCYVAAKDLTITMRLGLQVVIAGKVWVVTGFSTIRTGEDVALYELRMNR